MDMKQYLKIDQQDFTDYTRQHAYYWIMNTGVFLVQNATNKSSHKKQIVEFQNGVIRSNCVDCIDRTNTFQFLIGEVALEIQIAKLKKCSLKYDEVELHEEIYQLFFQMSSLNGDTISLQYGSSQSHKHQLTDYKLPSNFQFLTAFKRHLKNNINDQYKQHQIDLLLGNFKPYNEQTSITESKTDIKLFPNEKFLKNFIQKDWPNQAYSEYKRQFSHLLLEEVGKQKMQNQEPSICKTTKTHRKQQINMEKIK